ncbi:MAG: DUF2442 domain-containing protein [Chlamydiales bacterium]|nr:DUF2442 domain-containing protein [Chlamydiales bacterium]
MHEVKKAKYLKNYEVLIEFTDQKSKVIDFEKALDGFRGPIFQPLKDLNYFKTFKISDGIATLEWENGADVSPNFLYDWLPT